MTTFPVAPGANQSAGASTGTSDDGSESDCGSRGSAFDKGDFNLKLKFKEVVIAGSQASLDELVSRSCWTLEAQPEISSSGVNVQRVQYPMASRMPYVVLHPAIYRYMEPLCETDQVAEFLGVEGWREEAKRIWRRCRRPFKEFVETSDNVLKRDVNFRLRWLLDTMSMEMDRICTTDSRHCSIVRGTLAHEQYEVRGFSDLVYSSDQRCILAIVVETSETFPEGYVWYHRSRGVKLFNTLYTYKCPTLLVTPRQFKLFAENNARDEVYTYPSGETDADASADAKFRASLYMQDTYNVLYFILVMCLMRAAPEPTSDDSSFEPVDPVEGRFRPSYINRRLAGVAPPRRTFRKLKPAQGSNLPNPKFYTGLEDASGNPIYITVHVTLLEHVESESDGTDEDQWRSSEDQWRYSEDQSSSSEDERSSIDHEGIFA